MQNASKDGILQAICKNVHINIATLQVLQHTIIVEVNQLSAVYNSQKNTITTVQSTVKLN